MALIGVLKVKARNMSIVLCNDLRSRSFSFEYVRLMKQGIYLRSTQNRKITNRGTADGSLSVVPIRSSLRQAGNDGKWASHLQ